MLTCLTLAQPKHDPFIKRVRRVDLFLTQTCLTSCRVRVVYRVVSTIATPNARAIVEVSSKEVSLDSLVVAIPYPNGSGYSLENFDIDYEWKPARCETCKVFLPQ